MEPKFNLWIEHEGVVVLSPWRIRLLEAIDEVGSISSAAQRLNIPYRRAWEKLQEMETGLGVRLVDTTVGGPGGGGARLTDVGRQAIIQFEAFAEGFEKDVQARFRGVFGARASLGAEPANSAADEPESGRGGG